MTPIKKIINRIIELKKKKKIEREEKERDELIRESSRRGRRDAIE